MNGHLGLCNNLFLFIDSSQCLLRLASDLISHWLFYIRSSGDEQSEQLQLLSMKELIPGLQPLVLWMANSIELLHFIQHEVPQLLPWRLDQEDEGGHSSFSPLSVFVCVLLRLICMSLQVILTLRYHPLGQPARKPWQSWRKSSCSPSSRPSTT